MDGTKAHWQISSRRIHSSNGRFQVRFLMHWSTASVHRPPPDTTHFLPPNLFPALFLAATSRTATVRQSFCQGTPAPPPHIAVTAVIRTRAAPRRVHEKDGSLRPPCLRGRYGFYLRRYKRHRRGDDAAGPVDERLPNQSCGRIPQTGGFGVQGGRGLEKATECQSLTKSPQNFIENEVIRCMNVARLIT